MGFQPIGQGLRGPIVQQVNDAMPLLAGASSVTVMSVDSKENRDGHGEVPGADIAVHLARHGVPAQVERTVSAGIGDA